MEAGECYQITTPPNGRHWFVVAFPISTTRYLLFPFTTLHEKSDLSCEIHPAGDIPEFVMHPTVIGYRQSIELSQDAKQRGHCREAGKVTDELLQRILESGLNSKLLKNKWKTAIREILSEQDGGEGSSRESIE